MKITFKRAVLIGLALAVMLPASLSLAASQEEDIGPCVGDNVQGTIIAIDQNGLVTLETGAGKCTVTLNGDSSHPIVALLGAYFGDIKVGDLTDALQSAQGCVVITDGTAAGADCSAEGATPIQFVSLEGDTLTAIVLETGETITLSITDNDLLASIAQALAKLAIDWKLDGSGDVIQVSDQVAMYHDQGIGFGVLVKLYALSNATGVPVEELVAKFKGDPSTGNPGMGLGQLFKEYGGKPPLTGVGHVKQQLKASQNGPATAPNPNGNANAKNNGKAYGKSKDKGNSPNH